MYSYAALRITADAVRLRVVAWSSSCLRSSGDLIESEIDRVRLGSDAVLNRWSILGWSVGASRKRMSAMRRIADTEAVGVTFVFICSCSSGERERDTVLDRRNVERCFIVGSS